MDNFIPISSDAGNVDQEDVGGKGYNLIFLAKHDFNVPSGIIINTRVFEKLINKSSHKVVIAEWLKRDLSNLWKTKFLGKSVVIRSSANLEDDKKYSFAGQFKSIVNVRDFDTLVVAVEEVYASLYSRTILEYCKAHSITHSKLKMAIIIQEFIAGEVSGVLFTKDPITNDNLTIIEAVVGLNQGLVSGIVSPTKFVVDNVSLKKKRTESRIQEKKVVANVSAYTVVRKNNTKVNNILKQEHIKELVKLGLMAEELYKLPQDLEWTVFKDNIYVLQSRAITNTTHRKNPLQKKFSKPFKGYPASPGFVIGNAKIVNSGETTFNTNNLVMVAESTDTDMLSSMRNAKAIVTEQGGTLSHAAIVSRELGIPCVVGVKNARNRIKDGNIIAVDGTSGYVYTNMASLEHITKDEGLNEAQLYCFDKMKKISLENKKSFYYEKFGNKVVYYTMDHIPKRNINHAIRDLGVSYGELVKGDQDKTALAYRYYLTLNDPEEEKMYDTGINATLSFDASILNTEINKILRYANKNCIILRQHRWESRSWCLKALLSAFRAFSAYILINTMICEGYGNRELYSSVNKILKNYQIGYLNFLYTMDREQDLNEVANLNSHDKKALTESLEYYKVLKKWRKDSYPIFEKMGITSDLLRPLILKIVGKLNSISGKNLTRNEWFFIAIEELC